MPVVVPGTNTDNKKKTFLPDITVDEGARKHKTIVPGVKLPDSKKNAIIPGAKSGSVAKNPSDELENRIGNLETRLASVGEIDTDPRNWFEKLTNLPKGQNWFFDVLDIINRPQQALYGWESANFTDESRIGNAFAGFKGKQKIYGTDIVNKYDQQGQIPKLAKYALGFGLDVTTDPTNLIPASWLAKLGKGAKVATKAALPNAALEKIDGVRQGFRQMFGGKFAGMDEAGKQIGKDIEASQRYLTDKTIKQTEDLFKEFGGRNVDDMSMGQAVGRSQERNLKVIQNADELVDDILKGHQPRFNLMEENSVNLVNEVNKALKASPEVTSRIKNELAKISKMKSSLASINEKYGIGKLFNKRELGEALTEQELKALSRIEKVQQQIKTSQNMIKGIRQGIQIRPVANGKGLVIDNPYQHLFSRASIDAGKVIENASPVKKVSDALLDTGSVQTLIDTGKLALPTGTGVKVLNAVKHIFKEDIKVVSGKRNDVVTLLNPEKYKGTDAESLRFVDRLGDFEMPRPQRPMSQNVDVEHVARKLTEGNDEIRAMMNKFGLNIKNMEGYMKHILSEELAKNASKSGKAMIGGNKAVVKSRAYKGSAEDVNELLGRALFGVDAFFSSAVGRKKLIEYAHAEAFKNQMLARYGKVFKEGMTIGKDEAIIKPQDFNFFKTEGGQLAVSKADAYVVPKPVAEALHNWKRTITDEGISKFIKNYDKLHNMWKKFALFSLGFHVRNDLGNTFNMWISGMRMDEVFRYKSAAIKDLAQIREIERLNNIGRRLTPKQQKMLNEYDDFLRQGLREGSIFENDFRFNGSTQDVVRKQLDYNNKSFMGKRWDNLKHPFQTSRTIGTNVDTVSRYALYRWAKNSGLSSKAAREKVHEVLFDYSDLSQFEQKARRLIPFYTWMRNNVPYQLKNFMAQPGKYANVEKARRTAMDATETEDENIPEWLKDSFAVPVYGDGEGNSKLLSLNLPLADLSNLSNPAKMFTESLTPLLKLPVELGTNYDTFRGKKIEDFDGETKKVLGIDTPAKLAHAIEQLGAVRNLSGYADTAISQDWGAFVERLASGNMLKSNNKDQQEYFNLLDRMKELEDAADRYSQKSGEKIPTLNDLKKKKPEKWWEK